MLAPTAIPQQTIASMSAYSTAVAPSLARQNRAKKKFLDFLIAKVRLPSPPHAVYLSVDMVTDMLDRKGDMSAQRADAMLEKGCLDGQRVWKRVLAAVKEIQRREPREGEAVN